MSDCPNCGAPLPPSATAEYGDLIVELQSDFTRLQERIDRALDALDGTQRGIRLARSILQGGSRDAT